MSDMTGEEDVEDSELDDCLPAREKTEETGEEAHVEEMEE